MAGFGYTTAAITLALALVSRASGAQQASVSLTHTVVVTVPPRLKVQVAPMLNRSQQVESGRTALAVKVNATRGWVLVVGSKKNAESAAQWGSGGERTSSMVVYRNHASQRTSEAGGASDSEPVMLTVVAP
jgi:hypothetical protein